MVGRKKDISLGEDVELLEVVDDAGDEIIHREQRAPPVAHLLIHDLHAVARDLRQGGDGRVVGGHVGIECRRTRRRDVAPRLDLLQVPRRRDAGQVRPRRPDVREEGLAERHGLAHEGGGAVAKLRVAVARPGSDAHGVVDACGRVVQLLHHVVVSVVCAQAATVRAYSGQVTQAGMWMLTGAARLALCRHVRERRGVVPGRRHVAQPRGGVAEGVALLRLAEGLARRTVVGPRARHALLAVVADLIAVLGQRVGALRVRPDVVRSGAEVRRLAIVQLADDGSEIAILSG